MIILDGKKVSQKILEQVKSKVDTLEKKPHLAVFLVGEDPASKIYVRNKQRAAEQVGIRSTVIELDYTIKEDELLSKIEELNNNSEVTGILVQLPLPNHIDKNKVVTHQVIKIEKDENGKYLFHTKGIANLTEDPIVKEEQVYGKIVHEAKLLSFVYGLVAKPAGMFIFVIVPVFYIIGLEFLSFLLEKDEEKRNKAKKRKNNNKAKSKEKEE